MAKLPLLRLLKGNFYSSKGAIAFCKAGGGLLSLFLKIICY